MEHTRSYIICATPRSGTTLLCDLLAGTGVAGRPDSFFRRQSMSTWWADYLNVSSAKWDDDCAFDQSYLNAVLKEGAGGTPVFGMRLMWESLADLTKRLAVFYPDLPGDSARFRSAFGSASGPPLYVHLSREDKVAQGVSRLRAEQTGLWHVHADGTERERTRPEQDPVYDAQALGEHVATLEEHDAAWSSWFTEQGIEPLRIAYEKLSTEPQAALANILAALGLDPAIAKSVEPGTAKLADNESREWAARFRAAR